MDTWLAEGESWPGAAGWIWRRGELANVIGVVDPEARGRFYEMSAELEGPPPPPSVPDGMTLETLREEDARPFFDALEMVTFERAL